MKNEIRAVIFDWAGTTVDYGCFAPVKGFIDGYKSIGIDITNEMARKPMGLLKLDHTREIAKMLDTPISEEQILEVYSVFEKILSGVNFSSNKKRLYSNPFFLVYLKYIIQ